MATDAIQHIAPQPLAGISQSDHHAGNVEGVSLVLGLLAAGTSGSEFSHCGLLAVGFHWTDRRIYHTTTA